VLSISLSNKILKKKKNTAKHMFYKEGACDKTVPEILG